MVFFLPFSYERWGRRGGRGKGEMGRKGGEERGKWGGKEERYRVLLRLVKAQLLEKVGFINSPFWHCASSEASGHSATPLHTCSFLTKWPLEQPNTSFKALS